MSWQEEKYREIHESVRDHFCKMAEIDPVATLKEVAQELEMHYLRYGNNWTGRGVVGDTVMMATIEALELARAFCVER